MLTPPPMFTQVVSDSRCHLRRLVVGPLSNNVYLLTCAASEQSLLIDAADEAELIVDALRKIPGTVVGVLTTHLHADHHRALTEVLEAFPVPSYSSGPDASGMPVPPTQTLAHGDIFRLGQLPLHLLELRGHTPAGLAVQWEDATGLSHLISGDSLFPGGPGKTSTPQAFTQLMDDLEERVFACLSDRTSVYPGHGASTTVGHERPNLDQWRARGW